jgi:integrase/recombinase XerD
VTTQLTPIVPTQLTAPQFQALADVPPELEWFANLPNPNTRRAYRQDIEDFMAFAGLRQPEACREITRAHVIAWRQELT